MKMKSLYFLIFFSIINLSTQAQTIPNNKNQLQVELIPYTIMDGIGSGLSISYIRSLKKRYTFKLSYGIMSDYVDGSFERPYWVNGKPIAEFTNHVDINSPESFPLQVPDKSEFILLNELGIKHFKPQKSHRLNNYLNFELGYNFISKKKITVNSSLGISIGITNSHYNTGAYNIIVAEEDMWLIISIYSRYLYYGFVNTNQIEYKINDRFSLGVSAGLQLIMKKFKTLGAIDDGIFHSGVIAKVAF